MLCGCPNEVYNQCGESYGKPPVYIIFVIFYRALVFLFCWIPTHFSDERDLQKLGNSLVVTQRVEYGFLVKLVVFDLFKK